MDDGWEIVGGLLAIAAAIAVIVFIIVPILIISMGIGALFGGGKAAYNYAAAFRENVKPEQIL
jgi:hypothetical protein